MNDFDPVPPWSRGVQGYYAWTRCGAFNTIVLEPGKGRSPGLLMFSRTVAQRPDGTLAGVSYGTPLVTPGP